MVFIRAWETNPVVRKVESMSSYDRQRLFAAGIVVTVIVGIAYLFLVDPVSKLFPFKCPFLFLTGLYCPGCGSSRAIHWLLHGELWTAIRYNPLTVGYVPFFAYAYFSQVSILVRGKPFPQVFIPAVWIWLLLSPDYHLLVFPEHSGSTILILGTFERPKIEREARHFDERPAYLTGSEVRRRFWPLFVGGF